MELYGTFYIAPTQHVSTLTAVEAAGKWRLRVRPDPSLRHTESSDGRTFSTLTQGRPPRNGEVLCNEIIIEAESAAVAADVQSLIYAGTLLSYPDLLRSPPVEGVYPVSGVTRERLRDPYFAARFQRYEDVVVGAVIAAKAYGVPELVYALEKYRLSVELDSFTPHSAGPVHGQVFPSSYGDPRYHVKAAYAIVTAYSVIEELGLEIRSSAKNPIFLQDREWNPAVKNDALRRVREAGGDPDETMPWVLRGPPSELEEQQPVQGHPTTYWDGRTVRDVAVPVEEGLQRARYLRNFVMAHKFTTLTPAVSPYEVFNVQSLARRMLLTRLGMWNKFVSPDEVDWDELLGQERGS